MTRKELGQKLKKARLDAQINQETASKALNIPISSISSLESGNRKLDVFELKTLANLYSKKVEWFFNGDEEYVKSCYNSNAKFNEAINLIEKAPQNIQDSILKSIIAFFK